MSCGCRLRWHSAFETQSYEWKILSKRLIDMGSFFIMGFSKIFNQVDLIDFLGEEEEIGTVWKRGSNCAHLPSVRHDSSWCFLLVPWEGRGAPACSEPGISLRQQFWVYCSHRVWDAPGKLATQGNGSHMLGDENGGGREGCRFIILTWMTCRDALTQIVFPDCNKT